MTTPQLQGQVALITGASRGIGRAIALRFAREGAQVVATGRDVNALAEVENKIRGLNGDVLSILCEVTLDDTVREAVRNAESRFGKIDVIVHSAGYFPRMSPVQDTPDEEWLQPLRTNLTSAFYLARAVLPGMIARRSGSIILLSSMAAKHAYTFSAGYAASKAGLLGLMRTLAAEGGPHGIRVNALCPGVVEGTQMHDKVSSDLERVIGLRPEDRIRFTRETALLRRVLTTDDVADAALVLASSASAGITGQSINVDAGLRFD
jgi:NAD(P)-dependent dehydrogenase (short-subunit alcohol dehydrogenase family)